MGQILNMEKILNMGQLLNMGLTFYMIEVLIKSKCIHIHNINKYYIKYYLSSYSLPNIHYSLMDWYRVL